MQWDLFCLENTLPIVGTRRGKKNWNNLYPIAVRNVIQWDRAETHREAVAALPLTLMGAGPHPTRPQRRLWGEKSLLQSWKMRTKKRMDFKTLWLKWGQSQNLLKQAQSQRSGRLGLSRSVGSFVLQKVFVGLFVPAPRKYLFISR